MGLFSFLLERRAQNPEVPVAFLVSSGSGFPGTRLWSSTWAFTGGDFISVAAPRTLPEESDPAVAR